MYSYALNEDLTNKEFAAEIDSHGEWDEDENREILERAEGCGFNILKFDPEKWNKGLEDLKERVLDPECDKEYTDAMCAYENGRDCDLCDVIDESTAIEDYPQGSEFIDMLRNHIEMVDGEFWSALYEAALEVLRNSDD